MSAPEMDFADKVRAIREEFDRTFAAPHASRQPDLEALLMIRAGTGTYALSVAELLSVEHRKSIVALPGRKLALLGMTGLQGRVIAVYDLAQILNPSETAGNQPAWLAVLRQAEPVAFAFDEVLGYRLFSRSSIQALPEGSRPLPETAEAVRDMIAPEHSQEGGPVYVLDLPAVARAVAK